MTVLSKEVKKANNNSLNKNDMWSICKRLQQFSKQEAGLIAIGACALIVNSATNLAFPIMIGDAFDNGMNVKYITSDNFYSRVAILLCGTCASLVRVYCFGIATDRISNRIKQLLFSSYLDQDVQFFDEFSSGDLITALDKDVKESSEFFTDKIPSAIRGLSSTVFGTYYLFKISPTLVGVTCLSIPVIAVGAVSIQAFSSKHKNSMRNMQSEILTYVSERVRNMSTIHLNGKDNYERKRFQEYNDKSFHFASNMYFCSGLFVGFINFATNTSLVAILYYGGKLVANNTITPGELMSFLVRSGFVGLGIAGLSESYSEIMSSISASARIINYLDMKTITRDVSKTPVFAALTSTNSNTVEKEHVPNASDDKVVNVSTSNQISDNSMQNRGNDMLNSFVDVSMSDSIYCSAGESTNCIDISSSTSASSQSKSMSAENSITYTSNQKTIVEFHNVSFYYNQRPDRLVLCHLNLKCHENSITAIIGESGSGKSTILSMMCGFYTPTVGDVFVANENTKNCNHKLTLSKIGVVEQSFGIFSGTIRENISYGKHEATNEEIEEIAKQASAHDFIMSLPNGYDTQVGENGSLLSGGQRTRIALCRALLKNTDILILDEPSSGLDCENEDKLISLLTSVAVMSIADNIHVLEGGEIVASGEYSKLMEMSKNSDSVRIALLQSVAKKESFY